MQNRIRELREEKTMTQVRLSIELGVTQETISAYEIGKHYPAFKSLVKMSSLFGASIDYIMGLSNIRIPIAKNCINNEDAKILSLYKKMDKVKQEKTISYMEGLIEN